MNTDATFDKIQRKQFKLAPPEGGWGNVLVISLAVMSIVTVTPLINFGLIYGKYLGLISDESSATSTIICVYNTVCHFMGLVANHMLKTHSHRYVCVIGSISFILGNFFLIFATSVWQFIIAFGILQGIGFGLMLTTMLSCFNDYFIVKKNFMIGLFQIISATVFMGTPYFIRTLLDTYGYRGTLAIIAAFSLHAFAAALTLQPVQWHMIKISLTTVEMTFLGIENDKNKHTDIKSHNENNETIPEISNTEESNTNKNKIIDFISNFLELPALKDPIFVNICLGLSFVFMSELMFISLLPMFLYHLGYNNEETAYVVTIRMVAELIGRLMLLGITAVYKINNRIIFLFSSTIMAIAKIVFTAYSGPWLITIILISLFGLLRCFTQVIIPSVLAEYIHIKFSAAYGLFLASCGIISFVAGQLSSLVALYTTGDTWVQNILTVLYLLCIFPWFIEMIFCKRKNISQNSV